MGTVPPRQRLREGLREGRRLLTLPTGPLPRPGRRSVLFDVVLTVVLGAAVVHYALDGDVHGPVSWLSAGDPRPVRPQPWSDRLFPVSIAVLATAPLALRRRYPLAVLWAVMAATLLAPYEAPRLTFYACVIAAYSAAAYSPFRVPTLVSLPVAALLFSAFKNSEAPTVPTEYVPFLVLVPIVVAANGLRTWRRRTDEGRARLAALREEQAGQLRRAAERERTRIARELHDVVTHNVSVMLIQAGAARKVMAAAPEQATEALLAVEASGRAAMTELRHVMGLLTIDAGGEGSGLAPQPGLDELGALVARVRDAGVHVGLAVSGRVRPVPDGVELAAYRVVQEALTNTVKHATGASATVRVEYGADDLRVEVADTGGAAPVPGGGTGGGHGGGTGGGHGLLGLRERVALYGGTLDAGPRPAGGYLVTARLPTGAP